MALEIGSGSKPVADTKTATKQAAAKSSSSSTSAKSSVSSMASSASKGTGTAAKTVSSGAAAQQAAKQPASTASMGSSSGSGSASKASTTASLASSASKGLGTAPKSTASLASSSGGSSANKPTRAQESAMDSLAGLESIMPELMARPNSGQTPGLGPGATLADLQAFRSSGGLDAAAPLNMWDQFWADQNAYRQNKIDERAEAGIAPSEGFIDWNAIRYDLNQPYRDRIQREAEAKLTPDEIVEQEHARRLAEIAARTNVPSWVAQARADQAAGNNAPAPEALGQTYQRDMLGRGLGADYEPRLPGGENQKRVRLATGEYVETPNDSARTPIVANAATSAGGIDKVASSYPAWVSKAKGDFYSGQDGNLPGQVEGGINKVTAKLEEPSVWDKIVEGGGKVLEHTTLGGVVKGLFPDIWEGAGQIMKGKGGLHGTASPDDAPSWFDQITDPMYSPPTEQPWRSMASSTGHPYRPNSPVVPPVVTPPGGTPVPPGTGGGPSSPDVYDRFGQVVFPNLPPYNPGVDPEWLYFRKRLGMANGGIVGYAEGGPVSPTSGMDPRVSIIADAEDAIEGDSPDPQGALEKFVKAFGQEALTSLVEQVRAGMKMRQRGRMVQGPGGPKDDAVPAMTDDGQPVALSNGEFVMSADAVDGAGGPEKMQQLHDSLAGGR